MDVQNDRSNAFTDESSGADSQQMQALASWEVRVRDGLVTIVIDNGDRRRAVEAQMSLGEARIMAAALDLAADLIDPTDPKTDDARWSAT